jgi:HEAT repeat protein
VAAALVLSPTLTSAQPKAEKAPKAKKAKKAKKPKKPKKPRKDRKRRPKPADVQPAAPTIDIKAESRKLRSPNADEAAAAATALGSSGNPAAADALLDALALGLHPRAATAALKALAALEIPGAWDVAVAYRVHRNPLVRGAALPALVAASGPKSKKHVLAALSDSDKSVRAVAARIVADRKLVAATDSLLKLLVKGDQAAAIALGAIGNADVARMVAEQIGNAPDGQIIRCLGLLLARPSFGPDSARVEVVRALGQLRGDEVVLTLTNYVSSVPEKQPRRSRDEAEAIIEKRLAGGE